MSARRRKLLPAGTPLRLAEGAAHIEAGRTTLQGVMYRVRFVDSSKGSEFVRDPIWFVYEKELSNEAHLYPQ